jgi:hypothetical protein
MTLTWTSNQLLTGQDFQSKGLLVTAKQGKQSYSSTVVLRDDVDLKWTLYDLNATYLVELNIATQGNSAADIIIGWSVTGGATVVSRTTQAMAVTGTTSSTTNLISVEQSITATASGIATSPAPCAVREKLIVTTSTEAGTLQLQWCQNSSSPSSTTVNDYGWATARRIT